MDLLNFRDRVGSDSLDADLLALEVVDASLRVQHDLLATRLVYQLALLTRASLVHALLVNLIDTRWNLLIDDVLVVSHRHLRPLNRLLCWIHGIGLRQLLSIQML